MTDKEIQASDEEMEQFNVLQNEKCVSAEEEKKDLNCEEEMKDLKIQCEYCKAHCGEAFHFKLAKLNFNLEKEISELKKENDDLKSQIKGFENDFDYQNKVINKYKEDLKKLRVAYIQAQVANVISGTDFESILKNILNGELKK